MTPETEGIEPAPSDPPVELTADDLSQLSRLRAAMSFIDPQQAKPRLIDGRYELHRTVGYGGMGVVYEASDRLLGGTKVALKLVRPRSQYNPSFLVDRLRDEARAMTRLRGHQNIVSVYDVGLHEDQAYIAMEFIESNSRTWCENHRPTFKEIISIYLGAARGLREAHAHGIVHRDFKPDNILLDSDGIAKIADFGLAIPSTASGLDTENPQGTVAYMAPEQMAGERPDARSDQFSFCVSLWEMLSGSLPYQWRGLDSQRHALEEAPKNASRVPSSLRKMLLKGMSLHRSERHKDMDVIILHLENTLSRPILISRIALAIFLAAIIFILGFSLGVWSSN